MILGENFILGASRAFGTLYSCVCLHPPRATVGVGVCEGACVGFYVSHSPAAFLCKFLPSAVVCACICTGHVL